MTTCYSSRSSRLARFFSFGLLDGPQVCLCRPHLREAAAGFGLSRFATIFMNNPGYVLREGKHISMTDDRHLVIIPRHHTIKPGTLKQILEAAEISPERFKELR